MGVALIHPAGLNEKKQLCTTSRVEKNWKKNKKYKFKLNINTNKYNNDTTNLLRPLWNKTNKQIKKTRKYENTQQSILGNYHNNINYEVYPC